MLFSGQMLVDKDALTEAHCADDSVTGNKFTVFSNNTVLHYLRNTTKPYINIQLLDTKAKRLSSHLGLT